MKSPRFRLPSFGQAIPSVQIAPVRTVGPVTSVTAGSELVALRTCAKCAAQVAEVSLWSAALDWSHATSITPPAPPTAVGKTTAPPPALMRRIGDHVCPLSEETA